MDEIRIRRPRGVKGKKILGRGLGSGHGKTAGRGTKGQGSRAGGSLRAGFEGGQMPLYRRVARRGFSNLPFKTVYQVVNVSDLNRFADGETVTAEALRARGLARKRKLPVKILGGGELTRRLVIDGPKVSAAARLKIEARGGTIAGAVPAPAEPPEHPTRATAATAEET